MFTQGGEKPNIKLATQGGTNLTLLVFVLGILSLTSIGIMTLSVVKQLQPTAFTAINKQLNYQGKLQDSAGITLADGNYSMKFSVYDAASAGTRLWTECGTTGTPTSRTVAVANGVFSVLLGDTASGACPAGANANAITLDFNSDSYYLGFTMEADAEMTPRKRLGASGYAFNADLLDGLNTSAAGGSNAFVPVTDASGHLTLTQNLNLGGVLKNSNGNSAAPSYTFTSDPDTGFYTTSPFIYVTIDGNVSAAYTIGTVYSANFVAYGAATGILKGQIADGATAVGVVLDNTTSLITAGAKLLSVRNAGVEKAYINKDGVAYFPGANFSGLTASSGVYTDASKNLTSAVPTSGAIGYWSRATTTLSPTTANDIVAVTGNSGDLLTLTSTATGANNKALNIAASGATVGTDYGAYISNTGAATTNVGLYTTAAGATNNYAAIFDAGNVGIGTTSPLHKLHVNGGTDGNIALYSPASSVGAIKFFNDANSNYVEGRIYGTPLALYTSGTEQMRIDSSGRVGIGTTSPTGKVDIVGSQNFSAFSAPGALTAGTPTAGGSCDPGTHSYKVTFVSVGSGETTGGTTSNQITCVLTTGQTVPLSNIPLGPTGTTARKIYRTVAGDLGSYLLLTTISDNTTTVYSDTTADASLGAAAPVSNTTAVANIQTGGTTRMVVDYSGRVGIGTTSPAYTLDVSSSGTRAVNVANSAASGVGVYGAATDATAVANFGGYFTAAGTGGTASGVYGEASGGANTVFGVYGKATATGAYTNYGGSFVAAGNTGRGVYGEASYTGAAINYGGYFTAQGETGRGVYGIGFSTTATVNYGGYFVAQGTGSLTTGAYGEASGLGTVYGVRGYASNVGAATNYGGAFEAAGDTGRGVYGAATDAGAVINYGGYFTAAGTNGYGVYSTVSGTGATGIYSESTGVGNVYAVYADASNTGAVANVGGYFRSAGTAASAVGAYGVAVGAGTVYGVRGDATNATAVTNYGGFFTTAGTGAGASGVRGLSSGAGNVYGVYGSATNATAVTNYGGYFTTAGTGTLAAGVYGEALGAASQVAGVYGKASSTGAVTNYGGAFFASGQTGVGIFGESSSTAAAVNYGGKFSAQGTATGTSGVYGEATATGAIANYGGYFTTAGTGSVASGVYGIASGAGGVAGVSGYASNTGAVTNFGGRFIVAGQTGIAVYGDATSTGATVNYGGKFYAGGSGGAYGVYGEANNVAGTNYGVYGKAVSGYGVYGWGTTAGAYGYYDATHYGYIGGASYGVYGTGATGEGVHGEATSGYGVRGNATTGYGVAGFLSGTTGGRAVWGSAYGASGANYGGYFNSSSTTGIGVYGLAEAAGTVYGVYGEASNIGAVTNYGVYGTAAGDTGRGVYGAATDTGAVINYGGYFSSAGTGTGAAGVYGTTAATGTVYGVQGYASNTGAYENYGGYFIANGTTARAVYGQAGTSGATVSFGGYFSTSSTGTGAAGVYGIGAGAGTVYGVLGQATNTGAVTNYGGVFSAAGDTGRAVYGEASDTGAVANYGGYFTAAGIGGATGVYGNATGASGTNYGGYFNATSATGAGIYANTAHIAGTGAPGEELDVEGQIQLDLDGTTDTLIGVCKDVADGAGVEDNVEFRDCSSTPGDIAEWYDTTGTEAGDVVAATDSTVTFQGEMYDPMTGLPLGVQETLTATILTPSSAPYQKTIFGVISTNPVQSFGKGVVNVALLPNPLTVTGRASTKVSTENGIIRPGDPITSSSTAGVGMKATKPGMIIGYAVDHYSGAGVGKILVNIHPGWHSGFAIDTDGAISLFNDDFTFNTSGIADGIIQGYDSKGLTFRGSGWDGAAAQNVEMRLTNIVTDALNYKLSVLNNSGDEVAYLDQAGAFGLSGKFYPATPTGAQNTAYIFYRNNRMRTNAAGWATGSFDFAEMFLSHELLEAGDVVVLDEATNEYVKKSTTAYNNMALGIVSTEPGFLAGANVDFDDPSADQGYPVALAGRVPTKVSVENGPIRPGDFLTTSATSGVAMKATESGLIIGTALQSFDGPEIGLIKVFVNLSWYNVLGEATPVGEMAQLTLTGDLNMAGNYILNVGKIVGVDEKWSIDENGILKIKLVAEDASEKEMFGLSSAKVELTLSGTGRLENGTSMIDLSLVDPDFIKNISTETALKIIVTLTEPANGVYVAEKTAYSFRVAELNAGTSDAAFDWIVIARRKGYEDPPPTAPAPAPSVPAPAPSEPAPSAPAPETPPAAPAPSEPAPSVPAPSEPTPSEPAPTL